MLNVKFYPIEPPSLGGFFYARIRPKKAGRSGRAERVVPGGRAGGPPAVPRRSPGAVRRAVGDGSEGVQKWAKMAGRANHRGGCLPSPSATPLGGRRGAGETPDGGLIEEPFKIGLVPYARCARMGA
jgi:hypothetical protein